MRQNLPIVDQEFPFPSGETLVSTTDLKGKITYCNPAFIRVSGYSRDELLGQPHNLIRHPHMPEEAFRDMWQTIASGKPWSALVKNRRKDGTHYWVQANVTPLMQGNQPMGYMSVRTEPTRAHVEAADRLYQQMRDEQAAGRAPLGEAFESDVFTVAPTPADDQAGRRTGRGRQGGKQYSGNLLSERHFHIDLSIVHDWTD